ncbi:MAG: hypothetical protein ABF633_01675 [Clostridium sp.]|uniref:hypothetical protein n=1 Tax=Clostridium sp. TaxID=1506 RepID=UPI0039EAC165
MKRKFMKVQDIELISVNVQFTSNKTNEFIKYGISYTYKGEQHNYNFITVKRDNKLYDLDYLKKSIYDNVVEINGKFLTGLAVVDEKILKGEI